MAADKLPFEVKSLEEVSEDLRPLYVADEEKGTYHINVEGAVDRERHHKAIENGRALHKQLEDLQSKLAEVEGQRTQLEQTLNTQGQKVENEKKTLAERLENLEKAIRAKDEALAEKEAQQRAATLRESIKKAAAATGARSAALDDISTLAVADGWGFDDGGNAVRKVNGETVFSESNPGNPQTAEEYAAELVQRKPWLFEASSGDGARGGAGVARPGVRVIDKNDPLAIGKAADDILKGKAIVQ